MELKIGAEVFTPDDKKVGHVDQVVLDPKTKEATHFVVEHGFLLTEDKVVPMAWVANIQNDRLILNKGEDKFEDLPDFKETHYVPLAEDARYADRAAYWYPPVLPGSHPGYYLGYPVPPFVVKTHKNIPDDVVPIEEGAKVFDNQDKHVGNVERLEINPELKRVTHLVISEGFLLKERKLIPTIWVSSVRKDGVHLSMSADFLDNLPDYEPE